MIAIKSLIKDIRVAVHDTDCINYDDRDIIKAINAGLRFIRRTIAEIQPEMLMTTTTGILKAGEDTIQLAKNPLKIVEVTAGDKVLSKVEGNSNKKIFANTNKIYGNVTQTHSKYEMKTFKESPLQETNLQHIEARNVRGLPRNFYRIGLKTLKLYPIPRAETAYTIRTVDDIEDLRFNDTTPILNEFDDFLFEYCVMRLSLTNEYDMTQETQIMASIQQQIAQTLSPPPAGTIVRGYW